MRYTEGHLSLEANDASLDKVLSELSRLAMLTIIADRALTEQITVSIQHLPIDKAVRKILRGMDTSFIYRGRAEDPSEPYLLKEVRIHLPKGEKGETRHYTYERKGEEESSRSAESSAAKDEEAPALLPDFSSLPDADRIHAELREGNLEALDDIVEGLKAENPNVQDQINRFMRSLQEKWLESTASGQPRSNSETKEELGRLMQEMLRGGS
jgi:type II secretory pathway component GspD/PulD (secretin)